MLKLHHLILIISLTSHTLLHANELKSDEKHKLDKLVAFAGYIESSIANENPSFFNQSFNPDEFAYKVVNKTNYESSESFKQGFVDELKKGLDFGTSIVNEIQKGGSYEFLDASWKENKGEILFRLLSSQTINYHKLEVKFNDNEVRITDIYVFLAGEMLSESLSRFYNSLSSPMQISIENIYNEIDKINSLVSEEKYKKALKIIANYPEKLKNERIFQILNVQIASRLDKKVFDEAYFNYSAQFPESPGKYLIPLDGLMIHNEYKQALFCIDKLDEQIKTDPLLDLLRANIYYQMNDYNNAIIRLAALIDSKPEFENGYFSLLSIYIEQEKYSEATYLLDNMINTFNYYVEDFQPLLAEYPAFINSPEYKNWINIVQVY